MGNEQILKNIIHINRDLHVPIWIRVPTIPGHNDSDENIDAVAAFRSENLTKDTEVCCSLSCRLGESKNESLRT